MRMNSLLIAANSQSKPNSKVTQKSDESEEFAREDELKRKAKQTQLL